MKDKYLPLGTVCMLKGGQKGLMVVGYCPQAVENGETKQYDYVGCMYPEGIVSSDQNLVFNHEQIDSIIKEVEVEPETEEFLKRLRALMFAVETGAVNMDDLIAQFEKNIKTSTTDEDNEGNNTNNVDSAV